MKKSAAQKREGDCRRRAAAGSRAGEKGYVLLTLLLVVALMAIFAIGVIIPIKFEMQRDQEQEMIHRGVQYSRAIRAYYKKFGRYPTKLEDLDNTNNLRYLRKHYKDPLSCRNGKCQDFKLLRFGDPGVTLGGGFSIGGGTIPGASPAGSPTGMNGFGTNGSAFGGSSFGGSSFGGSGFGNSGSSGSGFGSSGFGGSSSGVNSSGVFAQSSGGSSNSGSGASSNSQTSSGQQGTNPVPGSDSTEASEGEGTGQGSGNSSQRTIGGGPIVGVASISKQKTIREFNHKRTYNEWQFLYDPATDRGGLITTPNQPSLTGFGQTNLNGQPGSSNGANGTNGSSFGQSPFGQSSSGQSSFGQSSFGQSSGFGNSSSPGGPASPAQPPANPPQQQQ